MAELADEEEDDDGRRLEAAAFPGMEDADGFQAFVPAAMRGAPARSPVTEMQFGGKKPEPKKPAPKPVAKKAAPKPVAKKPVAKKPGPKARPAARSSGRSSGGG